MFFFFFTQTLCSLIITDCFRNKATYFTFQQPLTQSQQPINLSYVP